MHVLLPTPEIHVLHDRREVLGEPPLNRPDLVPQEAK